MEIPGRDEAGTRNLPAALGPVAKSANTLKQDSCECEQDAIRSYPPAMVQRKTNPAIKQQVKIGTHAHAREKQTPQSELLERQHGEWLDPGATR